MQLGVALTLTGIPVAFTLKNIVAHTLKNLLRHRELGEPKKTRKQENTFLILLRAMAMM